MLQRKDKTHQFLFLWQMFRHPTCTLQNFRQSCSDIGQMLQAFYLTCYYVNGDSPVGANHHMFHSCNDWFSTGQPGSLMTFMCPLETSPKLCIICCMCVIYTQEQIICECLPKKLNNRPLFLSNNTFQHSWHFVACTMPPASTVGDFEWFLPITWVALLRDKVTTSTPYAVRSPCKIRNLLIPHIFILILCFKILIIN